MANTPNIDLVKPAGTDHALVSVLNANSDKIDTFAGTTNQAIATKAYQIYLNTASVSDCYSKMNTIPTNGSATFFATGDVMSLLTNGAIAYSGSGTIAKSYGSSSSASFEILCKYAATEVATIRLSSMTSSSIGTLNINLLTSKIDNKIVAQSEGKRFLLTATDGSIVRFEIGKLDASRNYLQWWLGEDLIDKGYIIFDVSRNV